MSGPGRAAKRGLSWSRVCRLALRLPRVTEGTSYGTPALHVGKRLLARLKEDGETMAIKIDYPDREFLLEADPTAFYLTDHYRPYPAILVRLKQVPVDLMAQLLEKAWRFQAPRSLTAPGRPRRANAQRRAPGGAHREGKSRTTRARR